MYLILIMTQFLIKSLCDWRMYIYMFLYLWDRQYYLFLSLLILYSELFCALQNSETCH